ncbi:hypothetical protein PoB_005680800 [Plakobranchus ocellatus]|uniref:Uncharacterized protein n=1 Tax=Plakobranchus ocellatus TaxID=259542 RepID=A0AAV4CFM8_9GAST|nr:hypothetical protein PoB_005680800 [Plakobranchus ocellatus]
MWEKHVTLLLNSLAPLINQRADGVSFQPTIAHHYVFHVSMGRSRRWPPYDTTLLNTRAPVFIALGLLTHGTTKLPLPVTKWTKNLISFIISSLYHISDYANTAGCMNKYDADQIRLEPND